MRLKHLSLFSGIGGFDLAAEWAGWENVAHCEWNEFGQKVLKHYWPNAESHSDITKTDFRKYEGAVDIISGGFPCQPYSSAGKRKGKEDERHLWPEMLRAIREIKPSWVVGENVLGLVNWNGGLVFEEVQSDLEAEGYEVQPYILPAAGVGAPHRRDRVWFVAYSDDNGNTSPRAGAEIKGNGSQRSTGTGQRRSGSERSNRLFGLERNAPDTDSKRHGGRGERSKTDTQEGQSLGAEKRYNGNGVRGKNEGCSTITPNSGNEGLQRSQVKGGVKTSRPKGNEQFAGCVRPCWKEFPTKPPVCRGNDGLPRELDGITFPKWRNESIKAYGNAIVPQVAYQIFKAINEYKTQSDE
jgi:DNA (cytosine-5)-methyltransferase 1